MDEKARRKAEKKARKAEKKARKAEKKALKADVYRIFVLLQADFFRPFCFLTFVCSVFSSIQTFVFVICFPRARHVSFRPLAATSRNPSCPHRQNRGSAISTAAKPGARGVAAGRDGGGLALPVTLALALALAAT